jgi:cobalt-precorrin-5B (C1)-methyltransferase
MSREKLKSGYTTGTHATAVVGATLDYYFNKNINKKILVKLPNSIEAIIDVEFKYNIFSTIKVDNDDLDVTKGVKIYTTLTTLTPKDIKPQIPSTININNSKIYIYGGNGVGVVTKRGLKIKPNYPAINPVPLAMIGDIAKDIIKDIDFKELHIILSIKDGERISKDTANSKVGVIGGLSILGTKGVVKPISSEAYIDSIEVELSVLDALDEDTVIFTLGNSAFDYAKKHYKEQNIIEVGNFVYDSLQLLKNRGFKKIIFITAIAKMTKVAQGCKNTHNRFGGVDFDEVNLWLQSLDIALQDEITIKGVLQNLSLKERDKFFSLVVDRAGDRLYSWVDNKIDIDVIVV